MERGDLRGEPALALGAQALDRVLQAAHLRDTATQLLEICKIDVASRDAVTARGLPMLVGLLGCGPDAATTAADALGWLFEEGRRGRQVVEAGAVPALVQVGR